jgi:hypothetical protein
MKNTQQLRKILVFLKFIDIDLVKWPGVAIIKGQPGVSEWKFAIRL